MGTPRQSGRISGRVCRRLRMEDAPPETDAPAAPAACRFGDRVVEVGNPPTMTALPFSSSGFRRPDRAAGGAVSSRSPLKAQARVLPRGRSAGVASFPARAHLEGSHTQRGAEESHSARDSAGSARCRGPTRERHSASRGPHPRAARAALNEGTQSPLGAETMPSIRTSLAGRAAAAHFSRAQDQPARARG